MCIIIVITGADILVDCGHHQTNPPDDVVGRGLREDIPRHMDMERTSIVDARRTGQAEVLRQKLQADNIRNLT